MFNESKFASMFVHVDSTNKKVEYKQITLNAQNIPLSNLVNSTYSLA